VRLLFITSTRLGDAVLSTGALEHAIRVWGADEITVACGPVPASLFAGVPGLVRVLPMAKRPRGGHWIDLWHQTVGVRWDAVIDLRGSLLAYGLWTRRRVVARAASGTDRHRVLQLADLLGVSETPAPRLWTAPRHREAAEALFPIGQPVLALGPTANWVAKQWPTDRFVALAWELLPTMGDARIAVFGAPSEAAVVAPFRAVFGPDRVIDATGLGDLATVGAALARVRLYVGNDSGLMHLAAAAGAPTLGLFGPSRETLYGPWGPQAAALRTIRGYDELIAAYHADSSAAATLMDDLSVERVASAARRLLDATLAPGPDPRLSPGS
jgi:heptosyltransferase III